MNLENFTLLTLFLSVVLMLLLTVVLIRSGAPQISKTILIALMGCQLISQIFVTLKTSTNILTLWPVFYRAAYPFELTSPPLIYLYIMSLTRADFHWKQICWYHSIPFLIGLAWYLFGAPFSLQFAQDKYWRTFVAFLVMLPYFWKSQKIIFELQADAKNQRSSLVELRLPWLRFLLIACYLAVLLTFFDLLTGPAIPLWFFRGGITNLALIGLTYYGLKASDLFRLDFQPTDGRAVTSAETEALRALLLKRLNEDRLYLKPQLRLAEIASALGVKSYKLSEVINHGLNTNFYDLINGMRIEHATRLMQDPTMNHLNLLGIAMDSGFNSKSVFNDYFRRKMGITPSEFREQLLNPT